MIAAEIRATKWLTDSRTAGWQTRRTEFQVEIIFVLLIGLGAYVTVSAASLAASAVTNYRLWHESFHRVLLDNQDSSRNIFKLYAGAGAASIRPGRLAQSDISFSLAAIWMLEIRDFVVTDSTFIRIHHHTTLATGKRTALKVATIF